MSSKKIMTMIVDHKTKTIIPEDMDMYHFAIQDFQSGERVTVTIEPFVRPVQLNQMGLFHKYVSVIAKETGHSAEEIKVEMKRKFGARNDDGTMKSTSIYNTKEMGMLIEGTFNLGVTELGLTMPRPEDLKSKNIK